MEVVFSLDANDDNFNLVIVETSKIINRDEVFNLIYDKWGSLCKYLLQQKLETVLVNIHSSVSQAAVFGVIKNVISICEKLRIKKLKIFIG